MPADKLKLIQSYNSRSLNHVPNSHTKRLILVHCLIGRSPNQCRRRLELSNTFGRFLVWAAPNQTVSVTKMSRFKLLE